MIITHNKGAAPSGDNSIQAFTYKAHDVCSTANFLISYSRNNIDHEHVDPCWIKTRSRKEIYHFR